MLSRLERRRFPAAETIVAYGDSLTYGDNATIVGTKAWPYLLGNSYAPHKAIANLGVSGYSSTQIKDRCLAFPAFFGRASIFWAGRNNYASPETVKSDIAAMVATRTTDRYLVLSVLNGHRVDELAGEPNYQIIMGLNADLEASYGAHYYDIRAALVASYDPLSPTDVQDFADDVPPTSLIDDGLHPNDAGEVVLKDLIRTRIEAMAWFTS